LLTLGPTLFGQSARQLPRRFSNDDQSGAPAMKAVWVPHLAHRPPPGQTTRQWQASDFHRKHLPTTLDGVKRPDRRKERPPSPTSAPDNSTFRRPSRHPLPGGAGAGGPNSLGTVAGTATRQALFAGVLHFSGEITSAAGIIAMAVYVAPGPEVSGARPRPRPGPTRGKRFRSTPRGLARTTSRGAGRPTVRQGRAIVRPEPNCA